MPGDELHKIRKATTLGVDCICMDIEDGVAFQRKAEARQTILQALAELDFGRSERLVRINALGSGLARMTFERTGDGRRPSARRCPDGGDAQSRPKQRAGPAPNCPTLEARWLAAGGMA
jgi:hypothetical protein